MFSAAQRFGPQLLFVAPRQCAERSSSERTSAKVVLMNPPIFLLSARPYPTADGSIRSSDRPSNSAAP